MHSIPNQFREKLTRPAIIVVGLAGLAALLCFANASMQKQKEAFNMGFPQPWLDLYSELYAINNQPELEKILIVAFLKNDNLPAISPSSIQTIMSKVNSEVEKEWLLKAFSPHMAAPKIAAP